jgi:hypothetical protein
MPKVMENRIPWIKKHFVSLRCKCDTIKKYQDFRRFVYDKSEFRQTDEYEKADCLSAMGISADGDCGTGDAL